MNYCTRHVLCAVSQSLTRLIRDPRAQICVCLYAKLLFCFAFFFLISIFGFWRYIVYTLERNSTRFHRYCLLHQWRRWEKKEEFSVSHQHNRLYFPSTLYCDADEAERFLQRQMLFPHHIVCVCVCDFCFPFFALFASCSLFPLARILRFCFLSHSIRMCNARWANALRRDLCYMFCLHFVFNFVRPQSTWTLNTCNMCAACRRRLCSLHMYSAFAFVFIFNISNKSQLKMLFTSIICSFFFVFFIRTNGIRIRDDRSPFVIDHTHTSTAYMYSFVVVQRSPVASNYYFYYSLDERNLIFMNYFSLSHSSAALVHRLLAHTFRFRFMNFQKKTN